RDPSGDAVLRLNWRGARHAPGPRPGLLVLPFRLHDPEGVLGEAGERGVCVALVDTTTAGVVHYPGACMWTNPPTDSSRTADTLAGRADPGRGGVFDGRDVQLSLDALLRGVAGLNSGPPGGPAAQAGAEGVASPAVPPA